MANIKSAQKRIKVAERNRQRNIAFKSAIRTAMKKATAVAQEKGPDTDESKAALNEVYSLLDRSVLKGIVKKSTAARIKSRLTRRLKAKVSA